MNLQNWISLARKHWKEFQPTRFKELKAAGKLQEALKDAAERTHLEMSELEAQGFREWEAWEMVRERYLLPPEETALKAKNDREPVASEGGEDVQRDRPRQESVAEGRRGRRLITRERGGSAMQSDTTSESILPPSPETKPATSSAPRMLTNSEVDSLLQHAKEGSDFARKAFSEMKAKREPKKIA